MEFHECADKCLEDTTIFCRSFSYSQEAEACSTSELDRQTAPPEFYNPPGFSIDDSYGHYKWDYFERKSEKYKKMEKQVIKFF